MILLLLSYLGGAFTIVSPCILPVLPFVFARADKPFLRSGLPLLIGMGATFAGVATLAAVGGGWVVQANGYGRVVAMVVLALFGLLLLFPTLADRATRPLVAIGSRLSEKASGRGAAGGTFATSLLLGVATGLLWAPCAGPILGLVLTGAALKGASVSTTFLLLAYAAGAATSLALALLIGGRVFAAMKRSLKAGEWIRRALGALVLAGVVAIGLGLDTGFLTKISTASTASLEQSLLNRFHPSGVADTKATASGALPVEGVLPPLSGAVTWLNSPPLTREGLRGKVVLVDFWTYSCINCLRSLPYLEAWANKYKDQGLVVIGVHAPEFAFEKDLGNVRRAVKDLGVTYPVAVDNNQAIWQAFENQYWPAHYLIDGQGRIRAHHFGEGDYDQSERQIQQLLAENGDRMLSHDIVQVNGQGVAKAASGDDVLSEETYLGYERAQNVANRGGQAQDQRQTYVEPTLKVRNSWALGGIWTVGGEYATSDAPGGRVAFRFHARDLHMVLGPAADGKPVRFHILVDGHPPGVDHGMDVDAQGRGVVDAQRLFQLVRQHGAIEDRTFEIVFDDPGVQAFTFTFG
jgi:cytochrome c biogenesis protein CcdA/thiol-disulfide isomerase/thioredoxin